MVLESLDWWEKIQYHVGNLVMIPQQFASGDKPDIPKIDTEPVRSVAMKWAGVGVGIFAWIGAIVFIFSVIKGGIKAMSSESDEEIAAFKKSLTWKITIFIILMATGSILVALDAIVSSVTAAPSK